MPCKQRVDFGGAAVLARRLPPLVALHVCSPHACCCLHTALCLQASGAQLEAAALQSLLAPAIRTALAAAQQTQAAATDLMLVVVLSPAAEQACGLDVHARAFPYNSTTSSPGTAVVLGPPRSVPVAKVSSTGGDNNQEGAFVARSPGNSCWAPEISFTIWLVLPLQDSGWVAERQPLEQQRPAGAAEVLLCTPDGRLLEGLVTNLFIVAARQPDAAEHSAAAGSSSESVHQDSGLGGAAGGGGKAAESTAPGAAATAAGAAGSFAGLEVWTASPGEGVVWGTARARVLEACRRLGLRVCERAPHMDRRASWREAFVTNSLRLVQPLRTLACPEGNAAAVPPWQLDLPAAPGPVTLAIRRELLTMLPAVDLDALPA